ncbi:MAG: hypothetical protein QOI26_308 [Pseudonocardiales bacterium]|nr:hypothetical protein [Pseudonocardiales bacterium]
MVSTAVSASTRHDVHGIGLVFLYFLILGLMLVISASGSLATRRRRGREALTGQVRGMERTAGTALRVGSVMTAIGAVGFGFWWLVLR